MIKIKSFTIIEIIIVMLLTTAVISIAFGMLNIFVKYITDFKTSTTEIAEMNTLNRLLQKDFFKCEKIIKREYGIDCIYEKRSIVYRFDSTYILRQDSAVVDTFRMLTKNLMISFEGREIAEENKLIDAMVFEIEYKFEDQLYSYKKSYPANVLIDVQITKTK